MSSSESALVQHIISRLKADLVFLKDGGHLDAGSADKILSLLPSSGITSPPSSTTTTNTVKDYLKKTVAPAPAPAPAPKPEPPKQQVRAIWPYNLNNEVCMRETASGHLIDD